MAIEKLSIILELVSGNYKKEAKEAADATGRIGTSAKSVTGSLSAMVGPAVIGAAVVGLGKMALAAGENADRLFDLQAQTGLSTEALQEWEFVAKAAGASTEVFSDAVKAVIKNLSDTEGATGAAATAYDTLGIAVKDANGNLRDAGSITEEVFAKLAGMENITARNALAQDIFGKKWEETISILDMGTEALADLREESEGAVVSDEALRNADKFRETWQKFTATVGPKLNEALGRIAPTLTEILSTAEDLIPTFESLVLTIGDLIEFAGELVGVVAGAGSEMERFGLILESDEEIYQEVVELLRQEALGLTAVEIAAIEAGAAITDANTATREAPAVIADVIDASDDLTVVLNDERRAWDRTALSVDYLRLAEIKLADQRIANLSPALSALQAIQDSTEAYEALTTAQEEGKSTQSEITQLQLEAAIASETAKIMIAEFGAVGEESMAQFADATGISVEQARLLYAQLGLLVNQPWNIKVTTSWPGRQGGLQEFAGGGTVQGPMGQPQLVIAHGGEIISKPGQSTTSNSRSQAFYFAAPVKPTDLQWLSLMSNLETLVS